jgi:hypothetical protein
LVRVCRENETRIPDGAVMAEAGVEREGWGWCSPSVARTEGKGREGGRDEEAGCEDRATCG